MGSDAPGRFLVPRSEIRQAEAFAGLLPAGGLLSKGIARPGQGKSDACDHNLQSSRLTLFTLHVTIAKWSVRVNNQFCICFRWMGADTEDVEIVDYH